MTDAITAVFSGLRRTRTSALYRYDTNVMLKFEGITLPSVYEVHFSNYDNTGVATTMLGDENGVDIPNELLETGYTIYAWIYLHANPGNGMTKYTVEIPVKARPQPENYEPSGISPWEEVVRTITEIKEDAQDAATLSESWAVGGTNTREGEDTDNAKYYSDVAEDAAETATEKASIATDAADSASGSKNTAQDAANTAVAARDIAVAAKGLAEDAASAADLSKRAAASSEGNALTSAQGAAQSANNASGFASSASGNALKSEGYAVGEQNGTSVASGSPYYHNNSKYYSEQASGSAETATAKAGEASQSASDASGYKTAASEKASEALGSAANAAADALKSEGYALGKQGGTDVESGSPYYQANSKYYKEQTAESASAASGSASNANTDALKAEGFAVGTQGGTAVESDSPYYHNNSKYYEEQAAEIAASIPADYSQLSLDVSELKSDLTDISAETRNVFSGEIGTTNGMTWNNGALTNTNIDGRTQFYCIIRFRNDASNIIVSPVKVISAPSRYAITLTPTSDGNNIQIVHNGSRTNLTAMFLCDFEANKTYTVSFNVDGYNPSVVGGLIISKIQVEIGDTATDYISHMTAYDAVARGGNDLIVDKLNEISAHSPNLFNGTISGFSNMEENDGKIKNTDIDTREGFYFTVRFLDGSTIKDTSATTPIVFNGRVAQTLTATADCTAIQVVHNGRQRNLSFTMPFTVNTGETYTVSLDVEGYDVTVVGGLILSNIQIELGDKETAYIPSEYTAVDYIARNNIDVRTPEAKLNVLLMGDSIFGNDGEIALFLDQMCNSCVNGAFGGTRVSVRPYTSDAFRFFDGVNIITALCTQTWTDQDAGAESLASTYPWITARLAGLKAVDMSKIDLLIMDWGTNDYTAGATIEDITTAYGAVIDLLQETFPELRILITTPIWRYWGTEADNENGDNKVYNVSTLKEIVLAIEELMKNKRISVLNAYQNLPLSYKTALTYFDANDKTHLNTFGNKVYAYLLHGKIRSIY